MALTMTQTTYTRAHLDREARFAVDAFRRTLPAGFRRSVKYDGWALRVYPIGGPVLLAYFNDESGKHEINIAI